MKKTLPFIFFLPFLFFFSPLAVFSSSSAPSVVYLLNSDGDVQNFKSVEIGFQKNYAGEFHAVDVEELESRNQDINKTIHPRENDFLVCIGSKAFFTATRLYPKNTVVFSSVLNWRHVPLTDRIYGVSQDVPIEAQMTIFKLIFPDVQKIGVAYSSEFNREWFETAMEIGTRMGMRIVGMERDKSRSIEDLFSSLFSAVDAVWLIPDPGILTKDSFPHIMERSAALKNPVFTYTNSFVKNGAVLSISMDKETVGQQVSILVKRLAAGETIFPRVQYPAGSHISINMKKVREMKIRINEQALSSVNEIIE